MKEIRYHVINSNGKVVGDYGKRECAERMRDKLNAGEGHKPHMPYVLKKAEQEKK